MNKQMLLTGAAAMIISAFLFKNQSAISGGCVLLFMGLAHD